MAANVARVVARRSSNTPRIASFPWWLVPLLAPFVTTFRELRELRYLWREPRRSNNTRLVAVLGKASYTDWDEAVEATLAGMGCLESSSGRR